MFKLHSFFYNAIFFMGYFKKKIKYLAHMNKCSYICAKFQTWIKIQK